jgi:hypothetical protein
VGIKLSALETSVSDTWIATTPAPRAGTSGEFHIVAETAANSSRLAVMRKLALI